jgi:hypothetical protein
MVADPHDDNLTDIDLRYEIELVGDLVVGASASDGPLHQDEVDLLLGVRPHGVPSHEAASPPESAS